MSDVNAERQSYLVESDNGRFSGDTPAGFLLRAIAPGSEKLVLAYNFSTEGALVNRQGRNVRVELDDKTVTHLQIPRGSELIVDVLDGKGYRLTPLSPNQ